MLGTRKKSDIPDLERMSNKRGIGITVDNLVQPKREDDLIERYRMAVAKHLEALREKDDEGNITEYDVVLPNSELGKYMNVSGISGYIWDETEPGKMAVSFSRDGIVNDDGRTTVSPVQTRWDKWGPTCGFMCGKELIKNNFKYGNGVLNKLNVALQFVGVFLARVMYAFRRVAHFIPWKASAEEREPVVSNLQSPRNVANRFTTEYRLVQNSRVLAQSALELQKTFREIEFTALSLSQMQAENRPSNNLEFQQRASILKVKLLQKSADEQMRVLENLLIIESRLVDKIQDNFTRSADIQPPILGDLVQQKSNNPQEIQALDTTAADPFSEDEKDTFEFDEFSTETDTQFGHHNNGNDEIFTAVVKQEDQCLDKPGPSSTKPEELGELLANQEAVMNQLRDSLRPRRSDMKQREKEAYMKIYGKEPDEEEFDDNDEVERNLRGNGSTNIVYSSSDSSFEIISQDDVANGNAGLAATEDGTSRSGLESKGSFVFGDEDSGDEDDDVEEKAELKSNLQDALRELVDLMATHKE